MVASLAPNIGGYAGFISPYSFAALFGLLFVLLQLAAIIIYFRLNQSNNFLYLSAFFASIAICCKHDFALAAILQTILFSIYLFKTKVSLKHILILYLITFIVPLFAYGIFLFYTPLETYIKFSLLPIIYATNEHTKTITVSFFSLSHQLLSIKNLLLTGFLILITTSFIYFFICIFEQLINYYLKNLENKLKKKVFYSLLAVIGICILLETVSTILDNIVFIEQNLNHIHYISWFPIFIFIALGFQLYFHYVKKNSLTDKDKYFYIISISSLFVCLRGFSYCFTCYFIMPALIIISYIFTCKIPLLFKNPCTQTRLSKATLSVLVILSILFLSKNLFIFGTENSIVKSPYGNFKTFKGYAGTFNSAIYFINKHSLQNDLITVFPQENLLNFLTRHSSETIFSQYTKDIDLNLNDHQRNENFNRLHKSRYIFISNYPYQAETKFYFGYDYFQYLLTWIKENYSLVAMAGKYEIKYNGEFKNYGFLIYKRNQ